MRKIILDFYDVLDEYIEERPKISDEREKDPEDDPEVYLADLPENRIKTHKELIHEYLMEKFEFPSYYGKNLDALYDCLTDIAEPTAVGFFMPVTDFDDLSIDFMMYLGRVRHVLLEAERDNPDYLAVITMEDGGTDLPGEDDEDEDPDKALEELLYEMKFG